AARAVDGVARLLRECELRGLDDRSVRDRIRHIRVHLEVRVRPTAWIAGREDRGEGDGAVCTHLLHTPEVILVLHALGVERVAALPVAVPEVDGGALERGAGRGIP